MLRAIGIAAGGLLLAVAGYVVYSNLSKAKPKPLDPFRREVARLVVAQISQGIPIQPGFELVVMPPLAGDKGENEVTRLLQQAFNDTGKYNLIDHSRVLNWLEEKKLKEEALHDPAVQVQVAKALDAEGVLAGQILSFPDPRGSNKTTLTVKLTLRDKQGRQKFEKRYTAQLTPGWFSLPYWRAYLASSSGWKRFFVWGFIVLILPVLAHPALRKLLLEESNQVNLYMLIGLTIFGTLTAYVAIGLRIDGFWEGFAFLVAFLATGFWNYVAATFVEVYLK